VHVPVDVEVAVLHPDRVVDAHRHAAQLAGELRDVADPALELVAEGREGVALRHRARVEHDHAADVHQLRRRLQVQEARIEPRQPFHVSPSPHLLPRVRKVERVSVR